MGSGPNEESEIFPTHAYTHPMESPPTPVPNKVPDIPNQRNTDPTELPLTPVPNQPHEIPPVQACTDITDSPPMQSVSQADMAPEELTTAPEPNSGIEDGWPLIQELIQLEISVKAFDVIRQSTFLLHVYLILAFGDIPAIALIMHMKGQNGLSPCQTCNIKGISVSCTYYVPLQRDKIPELVSNTMHLIFLFALMKNFWNKHMPSKWPQIIPHMNSLLNNMASKGYLS